MQNRDYLSDGLNQRILIIDDNEAIHADFRKIFRPESESSKSFDNARAAFLGGAVVETERPAFEIDSAYQGVQGVEMVRNAILEERPYAMAFIDVRMPPGQDGIETAEQIQREDSEIQIVFCTAHSDHSWDEIAQRLHQANSWLLLKKPVENIEVRQIATALTDKWNLARQAKLKFEELKYMVKIQTQELQASNDEMRAINTRLEVAKLAAEAANIAKSDFLANMSHEIRTPMTAVLGFANILSQNVVDPKNTRAVDIIQQNGEHLLSILNDVLDISKIEAHELTIDESPCSLRNIVMDVASLMQVTAEEKGLVFEVKLQGQLPERVSTDPTRVRQILLNLVGNAIKFTDVGTVSLVIQQVAGETSQPLLQFDVCDYGIGMTEDDVSRLFKPFMQADTSSTRKYGGTGLGLAISKSLAHLLGGDIVASCTPGAGCTFTATVALQSPEGSLVTADLLKQDSEEDAFSASTHEEKALRDVRILLAEDTRTNQLLISYYLEEAGAMVATAEDGRVAIHQLRQAEEEENPFDVILMDMQMPVLDGYDATKELRESGYSGPIIAITARAMIDDREKCVAAGCDDYLTKPIDKQRMIAVVKSHLPATATVSRG